MTNFELAAKAREIAEKHKTLYVMGCFGAPLTAANKKRYIEHNPYNQSQLRRKAINAVSEDTFGFDCVCLIKAILWGWAGDKNASYGGARYLANNVPDIGADYMITLCKDISTDFVEVEVGEAVWMPGHIGVYIGGGLVAECTPIWADGVQITACNRTIYGYHRRNWQKHGKLPWVKYLPLGDISGDGKVTAEDARTALRASVGSETLTDAEKMAGDMDGDGKITSEDAREILRKSVGLEESK